MYLAVKSVTSGTTEQNHRYSCHIPTGSFQLYIINNIEQRKNKLNDHFVLGLCINDAKYTLKLRYHILPKSKITLKMLHQSRLHHQLFDQFHISRCFECETNKIGHPITFVLANVKTIDPYICHPMEIHDGKLAPHWIISTVTLYIPTKRGKKK